MLVVGLGAAGVAVTKILLEAGVRDVIGCDSRGALHTDRADYLDGSMPQIKRWYAEMSNPEQRTRRAGRRRSTASTCSSGCPARASCRAEALARMSADAMVFAMANPNPEVTPEEAAPVRADHRHRAQRLPEPDQQRARVPGHLPRRARRARAQITEEMKIAAAQAIAAIIPDSELREEYIVPSVFNRDVAPAVADAVAAVARDTGAAASAATRSGSPRSTPSASARGRLTSCRPHRPPRLARRGRGARRARRAPPPGGGAARGSGATPRRSPCPRRCGRARRRSARRSSIAPTRPSSTRPQRVADGVERRRAAPARVRLEVEQRDLAGVGARRR